MNPREEEAESLQAKAGMPGQSEICSTGSAVNFQGCGAVEEKERCVPGGVLHLSLFLVGGCFHQWLPSPRWRFNHL